MNLLSEEYLMPYNFEDFESFKLCVEKMEENGTLMTKTDDP